MSFVMHHPRLAAPTAVAAIRVTQEKAPLTRMQRIGDNETSVDQREQASDQRIERRRECKHEPGESDGAKRRATPPGTGTGMATIASAADIEC
jgi:hypothetical protein